MKMKTNTKAAFGSVLILSLIASPARSQVTFTIENPAVQATTVPGVVTETFDTAPLGAFSGPWISGATTVGTFSTGGVVAPANIYGGAFGSQYYAVGVESGTYSSTLSFATPEDYVGLWWSAGDAGNEVKFFDGATLVGDFSTGSIIPYLSPAYYGNPVVGPNYGADAGEPFAYLDFTASLGTQITSVEFIENTYDAGFELDNVSVLDEYIIPPGHPVPDGGSSLGMLGGAIAALLLVKANVSALRRSAANF